MLNYGMWWVIQKMKHNLIVFAVVLGALLVMEILSCLALQIAKFYHSFYTKESSPMSTHHHGMHGEHALGVGPSH